MAKIIEPAPHKKEVLQKKRRVKGLILILAALILLVAAVYAAVWAVGYSQKPAFIYDRLFAAKATKVWAVYMNAGNTAVTYYGEITGWKNGYIILKDPSYIDVRKDNGTTTQPSLTFRKLADEFYRPKSEAKIFTRNIIFIQELSADSPIYGAYSQPAR